MQTVGETAISEAGYSPVMAYKADGDGVNGIGSPSRRTAMVRFARVRRGPP